MMPDERLQATKRKVNIAIPETYRPVKTDSR
jgi:hypothetical protein